MVSHSVFSRNLVESRDHFPVPINSKAAPKDGRLVAFGNCSLGDSNISPSAVAPLAVSKRDAVFGPLACGVEHGKPVLEI